MGLARGRPCQTSRSTPEERPMMLSARSAMSFAVAAVVTLPTAAAAQQVTFTKDIAPIPLTTYEQVRPWARAIKTRTTNREMPPWHVDKTIGIQDFKDDPSLSDEQIAKIAAWVDAGAPRGNPADMPAMPEFQNTQAWQIGEPDLVINFPKYKVPAAGPDLFGDLLTDIPIEEDRYIKAIQTRSATQKSHKVVHHALSYAVPGKEDGTMTEEGGQFLVEYASGKNAEVYPEGTGVPLKAGLKARVSYHLHPIGEEIDAEIQLGIKL